jgi:hypothetical protein
VLGLGTVALVLMDKPTINVHCVGNDAVPLEKAIL